MKSEEVPRVDLYSDGGAEPNPGKGGFGVIMSCKGTKKEFSQGFRLTTNNRMELMGVIYGLEQVKTKSIVNVYCDSRYVVNGITKGWAKKWKSNNWYRTKTEKAVNSDLWEHLLVLISNQQQVKFNWVKGHFGHLENERCDGLAKIALNGKNLIDDVGYERNLLNNTDYKTNRLTTNPTQKSRYQNGKANIRIEREGDACKKCGAAVILTPTKKNALKPGQTSYAEYYFLCPRCKTVYKVEEAKRFV